MALLTIMGGRIPKDDKGNFGCFVIDPKTKEVMHYAEHSDV